MQASVVVIGSGMGGATTALRAGPARRRRAAARARERLPREPENWSPRAVFVERRYKPAERGSTGRAGRSRRACTTSSAATRRSTARACRGFASATSARSSTSRAPRPAWPFGYAGPRAVLRRGRADLPRARRHGRGPDRAVAQRRRSRIPRVAARAVRRRPRRRGCARQGVHPSSNAMGVDLRPGGTCVRCATCDGFPCLRRRQERCRDLRGRPGAGDRARPAGDRAYGSGGSSPTAPGRAGRPPGRRGAGRAGRGHAADASCSSAGAVNSAALLLASADDQHPRGLANSSDQVGPQLHDAQQRPHRRRRRRPPQRRHVPEDARRSTTGTPTAATATRSGSLQLIGKVQGVMMKTLAPRGCRWPCSTGSRAAASSGW